MKLNLNKIRRFQEGGAAPAGGGDPMQQIIEGAMQAVQNNDAELALQVCQALVQLVQQSQGGGAPAEGAPEGGAEGEPIYRAGGQLVRRVRR